MIRTSIVVIAALFLSLAKAQDHQLPKQYFDKDWKPLAGPQGALRYRTVEDKGAVTIARDYYLSGNMEEISEWRYIDGKLMRHGKAVVYYANGTVKHEGDYREDDIFGVHRYYYPNGKPQMVTRTEGKQTYYRQFWAPDGERILVGGKGTIPVKADDDERTFYVIADSVMEASFTVNLNDQDTIFSVAPKPIEYKGGLSAMSKDVGRTLHYPANARRGGKEGTVFVGMTIRKDGTMTESRVIKGFDAECDAEALRTINALATNWNPAVFYGKPVNSRFIVPIKYKLSSGRGAR